MKMSKPQPQLKPSPLLTRPTNIPPLSNNRPLLNHDASFINKIFQSNNEVKQMAGKNYSKITERLPNVSSNIETIFSSDERLITAKQYINHYRNTKSSSFTKPFVFSKGNVSFRVMKDQIKNQFNAKSSTARSAVKDDQQQQQQLNTLNHSIHNYIDDETPETLPKESKYTFKESIDNLVFANTSKIKNKITPTNDRYTVDNDNYNYDDININNDMNKSHHSNILNSPPHRRSFNNVGNLSVSPGDIAGNEFLMKRSGLRDVCLTQRASRSSHSNGSSKRNGCSQLTRSVEIERRHKQLGDGNKGNYCINIFPLSMSVHLKMKQNEFNKKKGLNKDKEGKNKDNNSNSNVNMDLSYIYNNSKGYSRDVSVDNEDDIVNFKTSVNNNNNRNDMMKGDGEESEREHMGMIMVNPFGKKIKVVRKYKKKRNEEDDEGDVKDEDDDDNEKRSNCEDIIDFEFKDNEDDNEGVYKEKDKEIRISQLIDDKNKDNVNNEEDDDKINYMDDHGKLSKDIGNENVEQKEMNPFLRKQQPLRHNKPQNDIVDIKDNIELDQETLRRSANDRDDNDNDNECNNVKDTFNNELQTEKQNVNIIEDIIDDINVNKDHPKEDMEKINEKESIEETESEHIQNKEHKDDINNSISNEQQQQQHSIEHPSTNSDNHEQEPTQLSPQSTPKPKSQHSSSKTPKQPPSTESHSNNKHLPSQDLPIKPNSIFLKETPTTQNLLEYDTTTSQPKSQFIPPETIIPLDTPINSLTPQPHLNNITNELNEKLNSLLNALNTYDTGIFVFNIQNGKIANEQRYQNVNELYNALRNERHNELQIKRNSFDLLCTSTNDKEQLQDKESNVKGSVNKVMKLNTICSLINFTYNASPYVSDLNLKTFTPRMFQSHSNKKPTHVRTYSNPVIDNKSLHFFDSDIHAVANEIAYKEISRRKQSKQLSNSCALETINKEVNTHSFNNMKVSCNEVNINEIGIKKEYNNECQSLEGFDIKQDKAFRNVSVASNEVNVSEVTKVKRNKKNVVLNEIMFEVKGNDNDNGDSKIKVFKKLNVVSKEVNVEEVCKKDSIKLNKVCKNMDVVSKEVDFNCVITRKEKDNKVFKDVQIISKEVNVKQISQTKPDVPKEKVFKDIEIVSQEVNVKELSKNKRKIRHNKEKGLQIVSKEFDITQISQIKHNAFKDIQITSNEVNVKQISNIKDKQSKEFKDMQIVSKETGVEQISQTKEKKLMKIVSQEVNIMETSKPDIPKEKAFKNIQIVSQKTNVNHITQTKHIIPQKKEFKDMQIASNEVNVHQLSQIHKKDNSTQDDEPLKPLKIISNEINFNQLSIQKDTDNKPQDKSFKDIDIIYNEITINHLSSKNNKPTLTPLPPIYECELINELTIKQQRNYNNTNIIQEDIINITHPSLYSRQLPSTFQIKSNETLTIIPNYLKESTPTLTLTQTEPQTLSFLHSKAFTGVDITSNEITITHFSSPEKTNSTTNQPLIIQSNNTLTFIHENSFSNIDIITNETSFNHISQYKPLHHLLKQTQSQHFSIHLNKPSKQQQHIEITHTQLNIPQQQHNNNNSTPIYQEQSKHSFNITPTTTTTPTPTPLQPQNNINNFSFAISGNTPHEYKLLTIKHRHSLKFPPRNKKHVVITQQKLARFIIKPKKKKNLSIPVQSTSFECQQDKLANALKLLQQEQITSDVNYLPKTNFINNFFMKMCVAFMVITLMSHFYNKNKK